MKLILRKERERAWRHCLLLHKGRKNQMSENLAMGTGTSVGKRMGSGQK